MENTSLLVNLIPSIKFKIIDFLLDNKGMDYTKTDIAQGANISRASLFNYWNNLERYGIVKVTRRFGKTKLFTLNAENIIAKKIIELEKVLIAQALQNEKMKKVIIKH